MGTLSGFRHPSSSRPRFPGGQRHRPSRKPGPVEPEAGHRRWIDDHRQGCLSATVIWRVLGGTHYAIYQKHIGSTSVPGLRSKPIVDILAPVQSLAASRAATPILEEDGWLYWPDDPNQDYRLWFLRPNPTARSHHLQIIQHDHPSSRALIVFRDVLRRDVMARTAYSALKADLANKHQSDRNAYSNAKTEFVQAILEAEGVSPSSRKPV